jgi:uncharacterized protein
MKSIFGILLIFICLAQTIYAQGIDSEANTQPLVVGRIDQVASKQLQETRILNIYLPVGYATDTAARYPIVYLLDGTAGEDMLHIFGLVQFMNMMQLLPPTIVVGIANVDRKRDFTFPTRNEKDQKTFPTTGGSAKFIGFVADELQPYIAAHYRGNGQRMLIGQSLGGLLATEILLKRPTLFDRYMIVSPSLWWDDESLLQAAPALLAQHPQAAMRAFVCVGKEGKQMEQDAAALAKLLQSAPNKKLKVDFETFPAETHATILHRAVYRGFELLEKK